MNTNRRERENDVTVISNLERALRGGHRIAAASSTTTSVGRPPIALLTWRADWGICHPGPESRGIRNDRWRSRQARVGGMLRLVDLAHPLRVIWQSREHHTQADRQYSVPSKGPRHAFLWRCSPSQRIKLGPEGTFRDPNRGRQSQGQGFS